MPILLQLKLFNSITFCILTMKYMQFLHFEVKQKKWTDGCVNSIAIKIAPRDRKTTNESKRYKRNDTLAVHLSSKKIYSTIHEFKYK